MTSTSSKISSGTSATAVASNSASHSREQLLNLALKHMTHDFGDWQKMAANRAPNVKVRFAGQELDFEGMKRSDQNYFTAFPQVKVEISQTTVDAKQSTVTVNWAMSGRQEGPFAQPDGTVIPPKPNSPPMVVFGTQTMTFDCNGKIARDFTDMNLVPLLLSFGLPPPPPAARASTFEAAR